MKMLHDWLDQMKRAAGVVVTLENGTNVPGEGKSLFSTSVYSGWLPAAIHVWAW